MSIDPPVGMSPAPRALGGGAQAAASRSDAVGDRRHPSNASAEGLDGREEIRAYVRRVASAVGRHEALLNRLDAALGDGDHGENMVTGWRAVLTAVEDEPSDDLGDILRRIGTTLVASVGGASGPLYGTAFIEAGFALKGRLSIDLAALATAFEVGARGLARRGRCAVGDKTILDALAPAAAALRTAADAGEPIGVALEKATRAAVAGMRSTIPLVARRGLALRLGERSRGHRDPGATSCFLLVRALAPSATRRTTAAEPRPARSVSWAPG